MTLLRLKEERREAVTWREGRGGEVKGFAVWVEVCEDERRGTNSRRIKS